MARQQEKLFFKKNVFIDLRTIFLVLDFIMENHLKKAIKLIGGQTELANKINAEIGVPAKIKQQHIWAWINKSRKGVPAEYCRIIEKILSGRVKASQLRPDIYG